MPCTPCFVYVCTLDDCEIESSENRIPLFKERNWRTGRYRETVRLVSEDWATAGKSEDAVDTKGGMSDNIRRRRRQRRRSQSLC